MSQLQSRVDASTKKVVDEEARISRLEVRVQSPHLFVLMRTQSNGSCLYAFVILYFAFLCFW